MNQNDKAASENEENKDPIVFKPGFWEKLCDSGIVNKVLFISGLILIGLILGSFMANATDFQRGYNQGASDTFHYKNAILLCVSYPDATGLLIDFKHANTKGEPQVLCQRSYEGIMYEKTILFNGTQVSIEDNLTGETR